MCLLRPFQLAPKRRRTQEQCRPVLPRGMTTARKGWLQQRQTRPSRTTGALPRPWGVARSRPRVPLPPCTSLPRSSCRRWACRMGRRRPRLRPLTGTSAGHGQGLKARSTGSTKKMAVRAKPQRLQGAKLRGARPLTRGRRTLGLRASFWTARSLRMPRPRRRSGTRRSSDAPPRGHKRRERSNRKNASARSERSEERCRNRARAQWKPGFRHRGGPPRRRSRWIERGRPRRRERRPKLSGAPASLGRTEAERAPPPEALRKSATKPLHVPLCELKKAPWCKRAFSDGEPLGRKTGCIHVRGTESRMDLPFSAIRAMGGSI
mmetsp:Transcript_40847/g.94686  ORF Transcript_40847/g.94686 Transcript_40847/m.94686 type:complete len:321 (-) Transcript_40847:292-1254(-)